MQNIPNITIKPKEVYPILRYSSVFGWIIKLSVTKHANTTHIIMRKDRGSFPKNSLAKAAIRIILEKSDNNFAVNSLNLLSLFLAITKDSLSLNGLTVKGNRAYRRISRRPIWVHPGRQEINGGN